MLLSIYRTRFRTKKWYHRIAIHIFSRAVVNAWFTHKELCVTANKTPYNYLQFLDKVCDPMISAQNYIDHEYPEGEVIVEEKRVIRACDVNIFKRYDCYNYWPMFCDIANANRCKQEGCKRKTKYKCSKCKLYLCVSGPCFLEFHGTDA